MSESKLITGKQSFLEPLKEFEKKQNQLVEENPFIEIINTETFESAKKSRTSLVKGRTELQKQQKTINDSVNSIKTAVKEETERLIEITKPAEDKQQIEVKRFESIQETKRIERERIAEQKKKEIQSMIDEIISDFTSEIKVLDFENIKKFQLEMEQHFDEIDTSKFEDLEIYFSGKFASLKITLETKINELRKDQELLVSQSENRFQQFKTKWMERFMNANINNIHQLNLDFDSEVPEIDPDTFFTFKDKFIQETNKFRDKLIDVTNVCKLQQEKEDEEKRKETLKSQIKEYFNIIEKTVGDTTFETIIIYSSEISKSIEEIKSNKDYDEFKDLIELNISKIENIYSKKNKELVEKNKRFKESEKERIEKEKEDEKIKKVSDKKEIAIEKKRQKELKPFKDFAVNEINYFTPIEEFNCEDVTIAKVIEEFHLELKCLQEKYIKKINTL